MYEVPAGWEDPLDLLRKKWSAIPAGNDQRSSSVELLKRSDAEILAHWESAHAHDTQGQGFGIRGWYHEAYRHLMPGKKLVDVGCGMAISTLPFALMGARVTFTDVIESNVELVRRLCKIKGVEADFLYIEKFEDFDKLDTDFDIVTAVGSLINAPLAVTRNEIDFIKKRLKVGGRWLHFGYPEARWRIEGSPPFSEWGVITDGPGTPWMEYHDRPRMRYLFGDSKIRFIFECEWHDEGIPGAPSFNWFDIELLEH